MKSKTKKQKQRIGHPLLENKDKIFVLLTNLFNSHRDRGAASSNTQSFLYQYLVKYAKG